MGELVVIRVSSAGVIVSPEGYYDRELVERVKMVARSARRLARMWGYGSSRVEIEWGGGKAVFRVEEEDLLAVLVYREPPKAGLEGDIRVLL